MQNRDSRVITVGLIALFTLVMGYGLYQARGLLTGPEIYVPQETVTVTEAYALITGRAERIIELRLNGKPIPVTEEGVFEEPFLLAEGSNHLILEARDARGRTARKTLDIIYAPLKGEAPAATTTAQ